jgi:predicted RNA-binding protein associated with RNAse of E/G family
MNPNPNLVTVIKLNPEREETWRYEGRILTQNPQTMLIEARFNRSTSLFHGITLQENDRFLERYYEDRWYNLLEIHDREDDTLKGWYCNVTTPASFNDGKIIYIDLALDVLVYPNGNYLILDEDEFEALALPQQQQAKALEALDTLVELAESGRLAEAVHDGNIIP